MIQLPRAGDEWLEVKQFDDREYKEMRPIVEDVDSANRRIENGIRAKLERIEWANIVITRVESKYDQLIRSPLPV